MSWVANQLENILIKKGVSDQHIHTMKNSTPLNQHQPIMFMYYETCKSHQAVYTTVPIHKIKITSRAGTHTHESWFDLAKNSGIRESNIHYGKIKNGLKRVLNATYLADYHYSFQQYIDEVHLLYWKDDDIYSVSNDGNHRTIMAKLAGAPYIKARVECMVANQTKYINLQKVKKIIRSFDASIKTLGFHVKLRRGNECLYYKNSAEIHYHYHDELFRYYFRYHWNDSSLPLEFEEDFLQRFSEKLTNIEQKIMRIHRLKNTYKKVHACKYLHISAENLYKLHRIRCFFQKNNRNMLDFAFYLFCIDHDIELPRKRRDYFITLM